MKNIIIYKEISDFLLEDGFYFLFKTSLGWSQKIKDAMIYTEKEAELLCNSDSQLKTWRC